MRLPKCPRQERKLTAPKRSFYALSKHHHPDANPSDPDASKRFVRLSEAYSILSTPAKRAAYDRTLPSHSPQHHRQGSYHSTGPAGGRPASGLSHRRPRTNSSRGSFRGPPPSFYAQGGWGTHSEKRKAAHDESTGWWEEAAARNRSAGGMGPRQDPYKDRAGDVPHFDSVAHEQRGRREDERRARRMAGQEEDRTTGDGYSPFSMFLVVSGVLVTALMAPLLFVVASPSRKEPRNGKPRPSPPST